MCRGIIFFCRFFLSILCLSHLLCLVCLSPLPCLSSNLIRLCCLMCLICFVYPCIYLSTYLPIYPFCCWFFVFNAWRDMWYEWYEWYERNFSQWFVSTWRFNAKLVAVSGGHPDVCQFLLRFPASLLGFISFKSVASNFFHMEFEHQMNHGTFKKDEVVLGWFWETII